MLLKKKISGIYAGSGAFGGKVRNVPSFFCICFHRGFRAQRVEDHSHYAGHIIELLHLKNVGNSTDDIPKERFCLMKTFGSELTAREIDKLISLLIERNRLIHKTQKINGLMSAYAFVPKYNRVILVTTTLFIE